MQAAVQVCTAATANASDAGFPVSFYFHPRHHAGIKLQLAT
jgi:hypothetical protein